MDRIYHGWVYINLDGALKLIAKKEKCLIPTNKCFWKDTCDTRTKINTRAMNSSEKAASLKSINNYFKNKWKKQWWHLQYVHFF